MCRSKHVLIKTNREQVRKCKHGIIAALSLLFIYFENRKTFGKSALGMQIMLLFFYQELFVS